MAQFPSRFRRLDDILVDVPSDETMLLSELDGYLTGLAICPEPVPQIEWLPPIWGGLYGESVPFDDPLDVKLFADMVLARQDEILRELGRAKPKPLFEIDDRNGDVLWELWIEGFATAMALRPDSWLIAIEADTEIGTLLASIHELFEIAVNETTLTSVEVNEISDAAPLHIPQLIANLVRRMPPTRVVEAPGVPVGKIGRNAPCPCGSGKKHKRCCGAG